MEFIKKRLRSYAFWVALFAFLPILAESLGAYNLKVILPTNYENLVMSILAFLVIAGLVNDPTSESKGFLDDDM